MRDAWGIREDSYIRVCLTEVSKSCFRQVQSMLINFLTYISTLFRSTACRSNETIEI